MISGLNEGDVILITREAENAGSSNSGRDFGGGMMNFSNFGGGGMTSMPSGGGMPGGNGGGRR